MKNKCLLSLIGFLFYACTFSEEELGNIQRMYGLKTHEAQGQLMLKCLGLMDDGGFLNKAEALMNLARKHGSQSAVIYKNYFLFHSFYRCTFKLHANAFNAFIRDLNALVPKEAWVKVRYLLEYRMGRQDSAFSISGTEKHWTNSHQVLRPTSIASWSADDLLAMLPPPHHVTPHTKLQDSVQFILLGQ